MVIFSHDGIGLSMEDIGKAGMWISAAGLVLAYPSGWAVDKWHPIRVTLLMIVPLTLAQFFAFFFLRDFKTYVLMAGGTLVFSSLFNVAEIPKLIKVFPKDKFGQFCSCNGMVRSTARMIGGVIAGPFIDYMTNDSANKFAFRWGYMWMGVFQVAALLALVMMYMKWKSMGGDASYVPPGSAQEKEGLASKAAA